jgi:hypothetical protein
MSIDRFHARKIVSYEHHGHVAFVFEELKGKHHECCLCWRCDRFKPADRVANCPIANTLYAACVKYNLVTPVFECPEFKEKTA